MMAVVVIGQRSVYVPDSLLNEILVRALLAPGEPDMADAFAHQLLDMLQEAEQEERRREEEASRQFVEALREGEKEALLEEHRKAGEGW